MLRSNAHQPSIERRILVSTALLFAVLGGILFLAIRQNSNDAADEAFDRVLGAAALAIADTLEFENGSVTVDIPYAAFAILGTSRLNRIFYRVMSPDDATVTGTPILGLEIPPASGPELRLFDSTMQDEPVRIAAIGRYRSDATTGEAGWIGVFVAETREARQELATKLAFNAALPAVSIALLAFALIWFGIRRVFSPLRTLEIGLRLRTPADLSPITARVPREINALVETLNALFARLDSTLEGLQRVTADAAHQLRTPLTALRAQAEMALEETDAAEIERRLRRISFNAVNASVLANQLLTDATMLHHLKAGRVERLDLRAQARVAVSQLNSEGRFADRTDFLELELPADPVEVLAEPISLVEMIRNLLENACIHGRGTIVLALRCEDGQALLSVCDQGPGIPAEKREAVFERFVRNTRDVPGSGLGLAIVKDVVIASGGDVVLDEALEGGLCARIRLPLALRTQPLRDERVRRRSIGKARYLKGLKLAVALLGLGLIDGAEAKAQTQTETHVTISSPIPQERIAAVLEALRTAFPEISVSYLQARSPQIAASIRGKSQALPDVVVLPTPDIAVALTNEGLAARLDLGATRFGHDGTENWRRELFVLANDAALLVYRPAAFSSDGPPRSRLALAQMLEQMPHQLFRRIGIVNIGIDSIAYGLAAQDSLRSPLFWRLARAFGSSQARIYNNNAELLEALARGEIDIGYNVPMSEIVGLDLDPQEISYLIPEDYALSLPWTAFSPRAAQRAYSAEVIAFLTSPEGRIALLLAGIGADPPQSEGFQSIGLGPELLVFLDQIKRSRFLDSWFQLVTAE
jgi:two-component system sensor histidine kinase TctE